MAASEHTVLEFGTSSSTLTAKIHPLIIFNICNCYVRRPDQAERVIGTLLGSILLDGTVDILVNISVALDIEYHHNMLVSHQKMNPKEVIVGCADPLPDDVIEKPMR